MTAIAFLPQTLKTWRRRSARDVSGLTFRLFSLGVSLRLVYGVVLTLWPVIIANGIILALASSILGCKRRCRCAQPTG